MSRIYRTVSGDMWDLIAYNEMGSEMHMPALMRANLRLIDINTFPAGVEVVIPDVATGASPALPPWRR